MVVLVLRVSFVAAAIGELVVGCFFPFLPLFFSLFFLYRGAVLWREDDVRLLVC